MNYDEIIIRFLVTLTCVNCTATEIISDNNHGLSSDTYDYKSDDKTVESNPVIEGFIIFGDNQKKHPSPIISSTSTDSTTKKPSSTSQTWSNITKKTKSKTKISTNTIKTKSLQKISNHAMNSLAHRGRRLLNDFSYDTDVSSTNTSANLPSDVNSFLTVNDEELSKQLMNMVAMVDGSGFSMYR
jgi:hypothetical protein